MIARELIHELCDGCGLCIVACHGGGIIRLEGEIKLVETENCDFCSVCEAVCPHGAIKCYFVIVPGED